MIFLHWLWKRQQFLNETLKAFPPAAFCWVETNRQHGYHNSLSCCASDRTLPRTVGFLQTPQRQTAHQRTDFHVHITSGGWCWRKWRASRGSFSVCSPFNKTLGDSLLSAASLSGCSLCKIPPPMEVGQEIPLPDKQELNRQTASPLLTCRLWLCCCCVCTNTTGWRVVEKPWGRVSHALIGFAV